MWSFRRRTGVFACLIAGCVLAGAGRAADAVSVDGKVVAREDGRSKPVAGAWVRIRNGSETVASTRSGEDGSFHFHGLPRGRLIVEAGVHGWTTVSAGPRRADNIVFDCSAGGHCASVEFVLSRCGVITGRVVDEFGEPAIGAWVRLFAADPPDKAGSIAGVNTDDRGVYRFSAVGAGGYELNARIETMLTDKQGFQYAPASAAVEVEDNELTTAPTLVLRLVKKFRVSGRVESVSLGENPTITAQIHESLGDRAGGRSRRLYFFGVDKSGRFVLPFMPEGEAALWVERGAKGKAQRPPPFLGFINFTSDREGVILRPLEPARVIGEVIWEDQAPKGPIELRISTRFYDSFPGGVRLEPPEFKFERDGLPPIEYSLHAGDGFYIREVRSGDEVLSAREIRLETGEERHLTIVASTRFAEVVGRASLRDQDAAEGKRVPAAHYEVLLDSPLGTLSQPADQFGVARFDQVRAGDYTLCAFPEKPPLQWASNTNCGKAGEKARSVRIDPGATVEIDFTAGP